MGAVYRAQGPELNREVALKLPRFDGPPEEGHRRRERFQREARVAARVWHPNVCPLFDVGEDRGRPFVVMALVEGRSLAQHLAERTGPTDPRAAVTLVRQVLDGLAAVHQHGLIHRDLKPANILLDSAARAILTDFGLALPPEEAGALTSEGANVGTPAYMAPEQAASEADRLGPWTGLYSLGVVLYEMLTGRPPFRGSGPAVLAQLLHDEPPPPRQLRPDLDPTLDAIVLRSLQKDPLSRYQDAGAMAAALDGWAAGAGDAPLPPAMTLPAMAPESDGTPVVPPSRHGFPASRVVGMLVGGVFLIAGMALFAIATFAVIRGSGGALCGFVVLAFLASFIGWLVWGITESGYVSEELLSWATNGTQWIIRWALNNGVSPNVSDEMGETPLMRAAAKAHIEIVKLLLVHGAGPTQRSRFGQTAEEIARANGNEEVVALLQRPCRPGVAMGGPFPRVNFRRAYLLVALAGACWLSACWSGCFSRAAMRSLSIRSRNLWLTSRWLRLL
jgi:hypothetical protein